VRKIAVVKEQTLVVNLRIAPQMFDSRSEEIACPSYDSVHRVTLLQEQLRQIRVVLAGDAGDKGCFFMTHGDDLITKQEVEKVEREVEMLIAEVEALRCLDVEQFRKRPVKHLNN